MKENRKPSHLITSAGSYLARVPTRLIYTFSMYFFRLLESWTWPPPQGRSTLITPSQRVESALLYLPGDRQAIAHSTAIFQPEDKLHTAEPKELLSFGYLSRAASLPESPTPGWGWKVHCGSATASHRSSRDTAPEGHGCGSPSLPPGQPGDTRARHRRHGSRAGAAPHLDADLVGGEAAAAHPHRLRVAHVDLQEVTGRPVGVVEILGLADQPPGVRDRLGHGGAGAFSPEPATEPQAPLPPPPAPPDRPPRSQLTARQHAPTARALPQGTLGNVVLGGRPACSHLARPPAF